MSRTCIFCSSPNDLNTVLTVTLDDASKVQVHICDQHAEDATVRTCKEAYTRRQTQIEEVLKQAAALGLSLAPQGPSGLVVATGPAGPDRPSPGPAPILEDDGDGRVIDSTRLDRGMISVGGQVTHASGIRASVPQYASHDIGPAGTKDGHVLDPSVRRGKVKVQLVEGRGGMPVEIPAVRQDGTGLTRVRVNNTFDDGKLQTRFRQLADASRADRGPDFRNEYEASTERTCPICGGAGEVVDRGRRIVCPKCGGVGVI